MTGGVARDSFRDRGWGAKLELNKLWFSHRRTVTSTMKRVGGGLDAAELTNPH